MPLIVTNNNGSIPSSAGFTSRQTEIFTVTAGASVDIELPCIGLPALHWWVRQTGGSPDGTWLPVFALRNVNGPPLIADFRGITGPLALVIGTPSSLARRLPCAVMGITCTAGALDSTFEVLISASL